VPSLLRGFSAPVLLDDGLDDADLLVLLRHDTDPFNRWEAGAAPGARLLRGPIGGSAARSTTPTWRRCAPAARPATGPAFKAQALTLPEEAYIAEQLQSVDPQRIHGVRRRPGTSSPPNCTPTGNGPSRPTRCAAATSPQAATPAAARWPTWRWPCWCATPRTGESIWPGRAYQRVKDAGNMTERFGALAALVNAHAALADTALAQFHASSFRTSRWSSTNGSCCRPRARAPGARRQGVRARKLCAAPRLHAEEPEPRAQPAGAAVQPQPGAFHRTDAAATCSGPSRCSHRRAQPQLAGRLARAMDRWAVLAEPYRSAAREAIKRAWPPTPDLSGDVREIVGKALGD
jgi:aminopeptidase N